jgi:antitoxin VapB
MAFHIRDSETDKVVRELAMKTGKTMTDAVREAASEKLARINAEQLEHDSRPFSERISDIQKQARIYARTGNRADKAFYDEMSGDI